MVFAISSPSVTLSLQYIITDVESSPIKLDNISLSVTSKECPKT